MRTAQQKRASLAYTLVGELGNQSKHEKDQYGRLANKLPVLILINGLPSALEFLRVNSNKGPNKVGAKHLLEHLQKHFRESGKLPKGQQLLDHLLSLGMADYMACTREALKISEWHKRLAVSVLKADVEDHS